MEFRRSSLQFRNCIPGLMAFALTVMFSAADFNFVGWCFGLRTFDLFPEGWGGVPSSWGLSCFAIQRAFSPEKVTSCLWMQSLSIFIVRFHRLFYTFADCVADFAC